MDEYLSQTNQNLEEKLNSNFDEGLTSKQAQERLTKYGKNNLPKGKIIP